MIRYTR